MRYYITSSDTTNRGFANCCSYMFYTMVKAGWTVLTRSDGTTAYPPPGQGFFGFATGADGLPTAGAGANKFGNANAYIVMQQPNNPTGSVEYAGTRQFVFRNISNASLSIRYSKHGGFYPNPAIIATSATPPDPNLTECPGASHAGYTVTWNSLPDYQYMINGFADDGASGSECPYGINMFWHLSSSSSNAVHGFIFDPIKQYSYNQNKEQDVFVWGSVSDIGSTANRTNSAYGPYKFSSNLSNVYTLRKNSVAVTSSQTTSSIKVVPAFYRLDSTTATRDIVVPMSCALNAYSQYDEIFPVYYFCQDRSGWRFRGISSMLFYLGKDRLFGETLNTGSFVSLCDMTTYWNGINDIKL